MTVWIAHRPRGPRADRYFVGAAGGTTIVRDFPSCFEGAGLSRAELQLPEEALGISASRRPVWVEFAPAVVRDTAVAGEAGATSLADLLLRAEAIGLTTLLTADQSGALEWAGSLRREDFVWAELLQGVTLDEETQFEGLTSGVLLLGDSELPLETGYSTPAVLISCETGPGRVRVLATPGRLRLLWRQ